MKHPYLTKSRSTYLSVTREVRGSWDVGRKCCWVCTELHWGADLVRTHQPSHWIQAESWSLLTSHNSPSASWSLVFSSRQLFASQFTSAYYSQISVSGLTDAVCVVAVMVLRVKLGADWARRASVHLYSVHWAVLCTAALYTITPAIQYSVAVQNYTRITLQHRCCKIRKYVSL